MARRLSSLARIFHRWTWPGRDVPGNIRGKESVLADSYCMCQNLYRISKENNMTEEIVVTFPENLKVEAKVKEFTIVTDQPEKSGGDSSAPSPFGLFTASIATCAGYFALKFCRARKLNTDGMQLVLRYAWDDKEKRYPHMEVELKLPEEFPDKYREAIVRSMDQCVVKKHILEPPSFSIRVSPDGN